MASTAHVGVFVLLAMVVAADSLTMDEDATNDLIAAARSVREGGEVAVVIRGPHGKSGRREELLHIKGTDDATISLYYSRKTNKVSLESLYEGQLKSVSWGLGSHPRGTLTLTITSYRVKLTVGCKALHWHTMSGRNDMLALLSNQKLKLYHEENAPVEIYGNERAALDSLSCNLHDTEIIAPSLVTVDTESDVEEVKDFLKKGIRREDEGEEMQGDDYRTNYIEAPGMNAQPTTQRGDIPSSAIESCDDEVVRQLQYLRQIIENLRREIADQKGTIDGLRNQLRQCCPRPTPAPPQRCTSSSCYPGQ